MRIFRASVLALALASSCSGPSEDAEPERASVGGSLTEDVRYAVPAGDAWKAAIRALEGEGFKVERRRRDDCGGKIVARREDGHRVTVTIHAPERGSAEVTVYVEPTSPTLAQEVQDRIGDKLSLKKARADVFGEWTVEASYDFDLDTVVDATERACRALALDVAPLRREVDRAQVEARDQYGTRLRVAITRAADATETRVMVSVEGGSEGDSPRRLRRELERHLFPTAD